METFSVTCVLKNGLSFAATIEGESLDAALCAIEEKLAAPFFRIAGPGRSVCVAVSSEITYCQVEPGGAAPADTALRNPLTGELVEARDAAKGVGQG